MNTAAIGDLLRQTIGLEITTICRATIEAAIRGRMAECDLNDQSAYLQRLIASPKEMLELIDEVTVPETWFFRNVEQFHFLKQWVIDTWEPAHASVPLRVLCVPCSTGEEPYSVAMALLDCGLAADRFHVEAVDINHRTLSKAREAVYGYNSFREKEKGFRSRYFEPLENDRYRLRKDVAERVEFAYGNLVATDFFLDHPPFDAVFCRNLLIYLEPAAQEQVVNTLKRLVKESGLLFLGAAENLQMVARKFRALRKPHAFVFCNEQPPARDQRIQSLTTTAHDAMRPRIARVAKPGKEHDEFKKPTWPPPASPATGEPMIELWLSQAERKADEGGLDEASELCRRCLQADPLRAKAFFLLGIIAHAQRDLGRAEKHFRSALYLDVNHQETLIQLTSILENRGEQAAADKLRRRLRRAQKEPH
ncbi:MAG: CheR family methyltransferase [Candidatus Lernaella stagnicola]|nr:CheR family methyltransferase [Candidatus Lernaella stagnicola]